MAASSPSNSAPKSRTIATARSIDKRLLERIDRDPQVVSGVSGSVSLELDEGTAWTIGLQPSGMTLLPGPAARPTTRITVDARTLTKILDGKESGIASFLEGRLRVRGNLALALRLGALFGDRSRPSLFPTWKMVRTGRLRTFVIEAGTGPPVILLHGLGATNASMLPVLNALAPHHRVIAPDMPGFGDSSKPIRDYNAGFFARWLIELMDSMDIPSASVIGNSMGGRVAIEAALRSPSRIGKLGLLCPSPAWIKGREYTRLVRLLRPELAVAPMPFVTHRYLKRSIRLMFSDPSRLPDAWYDAAADEAQRIMKSARGRIALFSAARQIYLEAPTGANGFWDRLPELSRPALFIWGRRDRLVPVSFARHVAKALPAARSVILEDCGHIPQYEHPVETNELLKEFLDDHEVKAERSPHRRTSSGKR